MRGENNAKFPITNDIYNMTTKNELIQRQGDRPSRLMTHARENTEEIAVVH